MQKTLRSQDYARLIALLVTERGRIAMSQQVLATKLDVPQSFVAKVEAGERRVDVVEFVAIARALGVDPLKLFRDFVSGKSPALKPRKRVAN
ncbi:MAG: helix-turn-helix domain-containing protein [Afipia sp.]|nr:helix-turn-helix domain-containing protein [Afipia sp.]